MVIAVGGDAGLVHVGHVDDGLDGEQLQVGHGFQLVGRGGQGAGVFAGLQGRLEALQAHDFLLGHGIAGLGAALRLDELFVNALQVFDLQLGVDNIFVENRVHAARDVDDVGIIKAAHDVDDGIHFADVGQEFIAQPFAFARAFHQPGNVHKLDDGGQHALGIHEGFEDLQALVGHGNHAHVGLDGAERVVGRFGLGV